MVYEIRVYEATEGRANKLRRRFESEVIPRMSVLSPLAAGLLLG